jgi:hypothetical protein
VPAPLRSAPITTVAFTTCNGDLVVINGTQKVSTRVIGPKRDGYFRFETRDVIKGTGTAFPSGKKYTFSDTTTSDLLVRPSTASAEAIRRTSCSFGRWTVAGRRWTWTSMRWWCRTSPPTGRA